MSNYKPQDFAEMLGISVKTLQRWDREGKLKAFRTPTNRRYYTDEHLKIFNRGKIICAKLQNIESEVNNKDDS